MSSDSALHEESAEAATFADAVRVWFRIGLLSFGGPAAQIALMNKLVVAEKNWLTEKQFLSALSFCMLLPGPEAMQLATYAGWRLHGVRGGLTAGLLFVLPGALVVLALATIYALYGNVDWLAAVFFGIKAAVIIVVLEALLRVARKALSATSHWLIAALAFVAIFFLNLPYPLIVVAAAAYGFVFLGSQADKMHVVVPSGQHVRTCIVTVLTWLAIWFLPLLALWFVGADKLLLQIGEFFSRLAVVTFGGAYAVLAYLAQDVVTDFGWLTAGEMMDGLGLAETTPGPLILVTEFVGFLAGFREGGMPLALAAALVTLWVTFVPCFLWIFAGAPYIEWISDQPRLRGALSAITAAVVGVILNLSVWFALHVVFSKVEPVNYGPVNYWSVSLPDWRIIGLTVLCGLLAFVWHWSITRIIVIAALLGLGLSWW